MIYLSMHGHIIRQEEIREHARQGKSLCIGQRKAWDCLEQGKVYIGQRQSFRTTAKSIYVGQRLVYM